MSNLSSLGTPEQLRDPDYMPKLSQAIPLGIQHVMAMFISNVTPAIIIAFAAGFGFGSPDAGTLVYLIQMSMMFAGVATLIQTIGVGPIGAKLPIVQGTSFAYLPVMIPAMAGAGVAGLGGLMTGVIVGGVFHFFLGFFVKKIRFALPPLITGLIVLLIGVLLVKVGIQYAAGGVPLMGKPGFGTLAMWFPALVVIVVTLALKFFTKGMMSVAAVLVGLLAGYLVSWMMGQVSFGAIDRASWFTLPNPFRWGFEWNWAIIIGMCLMAFVSAIETVGDVSGITKGGAGREATDDEIQGATYADGFGTALAGIFGGLPNTSFSQNVGLISMTGVMSRHVVSIGAVFLIIAGLIPKFGAAVSTVPINVLGGGVIIMFGMVASAGVSMLSDVNWNRRNMVIFATSLAVGLGLYLVPDAVQHTGTTAKILLTSGLLPAAFIAIVLNLLLPEDLDGGDASHETQLSGLGAASNKGGGGGSSADASGGAVNFVSATSATGTSSLKAGVDYVDDVQLIDGIGNKTAKALAKEGAGTLSAIAAMSDSALGALAAKVGASGKDQAQEWKVQAAEMMAGKPPRAKVDRDLVKKILGK